MVQVKFYHTAVYLLLILMSITPILAQNPDDKDDDGIEYSFSADISPVSKYIWRGQRLTDGWSLQPSGTLGIGKFSINIWGNMDLVALNEGDALPIKENPSYPAGNTSNGLQGRFSEVDITLNYSDYIGPATVEGGAIIYTFPHRSASLPTTVELYGSLGFEDITAAPSFTLLVDVDETGKAGSTGLYFLASGSHLVSFGHLRFPGLEFSGSLSIVNNGFSSFYYGFNKSGFHDFNFGMSLPVNIDENWSFSGFVNYSALLGDFRNHQFRNPRSVYLGTAGSPASFADTVWGGITLSLSF